jgi:catechol 2,3-dioxygenase-like lactoylglutathione lyase family enzyme
MAVKSDIKLSTISYVIVYVKDTENSLPFYKEKLGMKVKSQEPGWVELETGETTLALHGMEKGKAHASSSKEGQAIIVFNVDDIYHAKEVLESRGVKFNDAPKVVCEAGDHDGMSADFHDPDGNMYSIFAMMPKKGK